MYHDIECPYCGKGQEINHDDGYGYSEDETFNQECSDCDKTFVFTTSISFSYNAEKAECLNGGEHDYKPQTTYPKRYTRMECQMCGDTRKPTDVEMEEILK